MSNQRMTIYRPRVQRVTVATRGPQGPAGTGGGGGSTPAGTGLRSVTDGVEDMPSTLAARVAADAANLRTQIGLGSVDNTSDANKPVSTAQAAADAAVASAAATALSAAVAALNLSIAAVESATADDLDAAVASLNSSISAVQSAAALALSTHAALTTSAHGGIVASSDARLSDARTPTAHASSHGAAGSDPVAIALSQLSDATAAGRAIAAAANYAAMRTLLSLVVGTDVQAFATALQTLSGISSGTGLVEIRSGVLQATPSPRSYPIVMNG